MALVVVAAPAAEPVSLAEAKLSARIDGDDEDLLVADLIVAARQQCEAFAGRAFVRRTLRLELDAFPPSAACPVLLPQAPLGAVSEITYVDGAGETQTWAAENYIVDAASEPGRIVPAYGLSWPLARCQPGSVRITYTAGYAPDSGSPVDHAANVPSEFKLALKFAVSLWYDNRAPGEALPAGTRALLSAKRIKNV